MSQNHSPTEAGAPSAATASSATAWTSGQCSASRFRIRASAARSASVTGLASDLVSTAVSARQ